MAKYAIKWCPVGTLVQRSAIQVNAQVLVAESLNFRPANAEQFLWTSNAEWENKHFAVLYAKSSFPAASTSVGKVVKITHVENAESNWLNFVCVERMPVLKFVELKPRSSNANKPVILCYLVEFILARMDVTRKDYVKIVRWGLTQISFVTVEAPSYPKNSTVLVKPA